MLGRIIAFGAIIAMVILGLVWQTTTPTTIGPIGILFVFILMYVSVLGMLTFLLLGVNRVILRVFKSMSLRARAVPMSLIRAYYFASVLALAPVMVVGMQSVGKVSIYELSLVAIFLVIACIYIAKRTR